MKTCTRCGERKRADQFYPDKGHKDGLTSACRPCVKAQATAWQKAHPERRREIQHKHNLKRWAARNG